MIRRILLAAACAIGLASPGVAGEVVVFAAASLKDALDSVAAEFEAKTGHTVTLSYAGSNALARQIIAGAPADIFLSAAVNWMEEVEKVDDVASASRVDLLGNSLVLIAHGKDAPLVQITAGFDLATRLG